VKRALWLIFGGLALLAAAVLFRSGPTGDAAARVESTTPPPAALPDVRVKHEFIEIPIPAPQPSPARTPHRSASAAKKRPQVPPGAGTSADGVRTASAVSEVEAADQPASLLVRAGRAIVGDGKHRPEPFPRIKKD
jgi:hypothetical protein